MARDSSRDKGHTTVSSTIKGEAGSLINQYSAEDEEEDLLEPQFYPDATLFRTSLEGLSHDEEMFKRNLTNKATLQAIAPYLNLKIKDQKRKIESAKRRPKSEDETFTKKSKEQIISVVPDLSDDPELILSIVETVKTIKDLINAKKFLFYLVNHEKNELRCIPNEDWKGREEVTLKIEEGTTLAAFTAFKGDIFNTDNVLTDSRFPRGLGIPDSIAKFGLGVPIKTPDDELIAVCEFYRDAFSIPFEKKDEKMVIVLAGWVGAGVLQKSIFLNLQRQYEVTQCLQQLSFHYHCNFVNTEQSFSHFVLLARETIGAEHCIFYLVVKMTEDYFIVEEYEQEAEESRIVVKKYANRVIQEKGSYLYKVLMDKEKVNLSGNEIKETDPGIKSILCVPILCNCKQVVGAIQLTNKRSEERFSKDDETTMITFSTYFAIQFYHDKTNNNARKAVLLNDITLDILNYQLKPCTHDQEAFKRKKITPLPENFFTFAWYPTPDDMPRLAEITISMFQEVLGDNFMVLNNVPRFILTVQKCYRPNPYHNFLHAFVVTHTMANIISRYHYIFNGLERKGLMIAALCHDVDHRGYTNNFIHLTKHYLSSLYSSSYLENHHFTVAKMIIQKCGLFSYLKPAIYDALIQGIYKYIIATDLALYFQCSMEFMRAADEKSFSFKNPNHRHLVMSLIMTTCDLSGQTKPMAISSKITEDVYEEFYQQGDIEKKMGYVPIPSMDRDKRDMIYENQVQFLNVAVIPCIETVSRIFSMLSPMVEDTKALMRQWKKLGESRERQETI